MRPRESNCEGLGSTVSDDDWISEQNWENLFSFLATILLWTGAALTTWGQSIGASGVLGAFLGTHAAMELGALCLLMSTCIAGYVASLLTEKFGQDADKYMRPPVDRRSRYSHFLGFVGTILVVLSVTEAILLSGLVAIEAIKIPFAQGGGPSSINRGIILLASVGLAALGSLFFTADALREKRDANDEDFSVRAFWGGLWFRMGESILFALVLFLLLAGNQSNGSSDSYDRYFGLFPLIALLMGMFVKSGERLIFGIAHRLFAAVEALVPATKERPLGTDTQNSPGRPQNVRLDEGDGRTLRWEPPENGSSPTSYRVFEIVDGSENLLEELPAHHLEYVVKIDAGKVFVRAVCGKVAGEPSEPIQVDPR